MTSRLIQRTEIIPDAKGGGEADDSLREAKESISHQRNKILTARLTNGNFFLVTVALSLYSSSQTECSGTLGRHTALATRVRSTVFVPIARKLENLGILAAQSSRNLFLEPTSSLKATRYSSGREMAYTFRFTHNSKAITNIVDDC